MIKNFETITHNLTELELELVPFVVEMLVKTNRDKQILNSNISNNIAKLCHVNINAARIRKIIHYIRANRIIPVIATSNGYFVSYKHADIKEQIESLNSRANAIKDVAKSLEHFITVNNQLSLF